MYCIQKDNARLGNFINLTPTLQSMAKHYGHPVPTYFETLYVKECFIDAPFLEIIDKLPAEDIAPAITSEAYKRRAYETPDYQYIWDRYNAMLAFDKPIPHTYVDKPMLHGVADLFGRFAVVSNGSGFYDGTYEHLKLIDNQIWIDVLGQLGMRTVFVGSEADKPYAPPCDYYFIGDIRQSLALIARSQVVVTCDGGMMHAAVAMKRATFILWKNTNSIKSAPPGGYICKGDYVREFETWFGNLQKEE